MRQRRFSVGGQDPVHFDVDSSGGIRALARQDGLVPVIGGQWSLGEPEMPTAWSDVEEATGNNARISDGTELYTGAGFDASLIEGQAEDVVWVLDHCSSAQLRDMLSAAG